jgi:hypothetical protein
MADDDKTLTSMSACTEMTSKGYHSIFRRTHRFTLKGNVQVYQTGRLPHMTAVFNLKIIRHDTNLMSQLS